MFLIHLHWHANAYHDIGATGPDREPSGRRVQERVPRTCAMFVVDITCPECDRTSPVQKVALGEYRCTECDVEFSHHDVR